MSRILEFQHADEQTVVARVLLELHQAIDLHFPQAKGTSRQFSKTLLATQADSSTAIDNQPAIAAAKAGGVAVAAVAPTIPAKPAAKAPKANTGFGIEFSKQGSMVGGLSATMMQESRWSRWLTRVLLLSLFLGTVLLAWIYMFGIPHVRDAW